MFMGFILHIYIIFGTNLLTGGPTPICCFMPISVFRGKGISDGVKTSWNFTMIFYGLEETHGASKMDDTSILHHAFISIFIALWAVITHMSRCLWLFSLILQGLSWRGRMPATAPRWYLADTEGYGGRNISSGGSWMFSGYVDLYRRKKYVGGPKGGPRGRGVRPYPRELLLHLLT